MKLFTLIFLLTVLALTSCKTETISDVTYGINTGLTSKNITQGRNMIDYDQGGHFYCRTRFSGAFGNEKDELEGEKKVRDFIWEHLADKKRGYIQISCPGVDTGNTTHYFIEPNEKGEWNVIGRNIYKSSDDKTTLKDSVFNSIERAESKDNKGWQIVLKSADNEVIQKLPFY
jgi:hypothetical protein